MQSTFNWYWLVDGLMDAGYPVSLVNTSAVQQYEGLELTDDRHDARWLAHLMRLDILPTGSIHPKEERPVRNLLRQRGRLVQQRQTAGVVRRADRCLVARLHDRRVPLELVGLALRLATARRQARPRSEPPLPTIRSLHYFLLVLDELADPRLDPRYLDYLRYRLTPLEPTRPQNPAPHRRP